MSTVQKKQIPMTPVDSSNIEAVGYEDSTRTLAVRFIGGATYHYHDVPADIHLSFEMAESLGKYLQEHIKGRYRYTKQK